MLGLIWSWSKPLLSNKDLLSPFKTGFDLFANAVQAGQADAVIAGMSITDARKEIFDFSDAYYSSNILLAVKNGSDIASYEDLKGKNSRR